MKSIFVKKLLTSNIDILLGERFVGYAVITSAGDKFTSVELFFPLGLSSEEEISIAPTANLFSIEYIASIDEQSAKTALMNSLRKCLLGLPINLSLRLNRHTFNVKCFDGDIKKEFIMHYNYSRIPAMKEVFSQYGLNNKYLMSEDDQRIFDDVLSGIANTDVKSDDEENWNIDLPH